MGCSWRATSRANVANFKNFCPSCPWLPGASSPLIEEKSGQGGAPRNRTRTFPSVLKSCTVWATSWGSSSKKSPRQTISGMWCCATRMASGSMSQAMTLRSGPKSCCKIQGPVPMPSNQLSTTKSRPRCWDELGTKLTTDDSPEVGAAAVWSGIPPSGSGGTPCCPYFLFLDHDWSQVSWCQLLRVSCCHWPPCCW